MKHTGRKLLTLLLALLMVLGTVSGALAADSTNAIAPLEYTGADVTFIKEDGSAFGMFAPQEGTTCVIDGGSVVIHYVPKNTTVYGALHFGSITDEELTADVTFNEDGSFDITRPKADCGMAYPIAPIKKSDGGTTSAQYYLAIPAADQLEDVTPEALPFSYDGAEVNFIKEDGSQFGMFAPQEGTTCVIDGGSVVIHYVPKNTTVYGALHFGSITDEELTADVTFNEDGTFDITRPKADCGMAYPIAPIKKTDGGTTSAQYYLAIPAADKLEDVTPEAAPFPYDGAEVNFIKEDGSQFGMFTPQEGTTCVIDGNNVVIHYVPKNTTVYGALHFGSFTDEELTADITFNEDGSFDITRPKADCGMAYPVAPIKKSDGGTTSSQFYLAIPAADKLEDVTPEAAPFPYDGAEVNFIKEDGSQFGMFTPQEGTTCVIDGNNVVIHYVPKNTTVYGALHFGSIYDEELTADVTFNEDGTFDFTRPKTDCGMAWPIAPIKKSDGGTTSSQFYLAIPAADKLEDVTGEPEEPEDPEEPEEPEEITVTVSISVAGQFVTAADGSIVAAAEVTVTDLDGSGDFNIDEALKAAHEAFYPGGAAAGYASSTGDWGLSIDKLWGDESYAFGYYVNDTMAMGLADSVAEGDYVAAFVYADKKTYTDAYSYFDKRSAQAEDGMLTLTLYAFSEYDESWNPVFAPLAGAAITVDGEDSGFVTGEDGSVTLSFQEAGSFLLSAKHEDPALVPPVCRATVSEAAAGEEDEEGRVDLEIINNTGMFKGLYAYVETVDGESTLVVALTGSTYHYLIPGNYAQALDKGTDRSDWIQGEQDAEGKWFFRLPMEEGQTYFPVVSVSQTYLDKYEAGENPLERSYFPRQFQLDLDAATLTVGDYAETLPFQVSSSVPTLRTADSTDVSIVGGPNSNNYNVRFALAVENETYDQVRYPSVVDGQIDTVTAPLEDGSFDFDLLNAPAKEAFRDKEPISVFFRVAATGDEKEYTLTIDLLAQTILIEGDDSGVSSGEEEEGEETGLTIEAEVEDGTVKATVSPEAVEAALAESENPGTLGVVVVSEGADTIVLTFPAEALEKAAEAQVSLRAETELGTVTLDKGSVRKLADESVDAVLTLASENGGLRLEITAEDNLIPLTLRVCLPAQSGQVLLLRQADGSEAVVKKSLVEDGKVYAILPIPAVVRVGDRGLAFSDVTDQWFRQAVDFASSHELLTGVSDTEFGPLTGMTRAMVVTVLYRLEGEPKAENAAPFGDVPAGKWYSDAVAWAAAKGIVLGNGSGFAPNDPVTREQLAAILWRYAAMLGLESRSGSTDAFPDAASVSAWAKDAMGWAVRVGLFRGDDAGNLNPRAGATRAEVASLLSRLIGLIVK